MIVTVRGAKDRSLVKLLKMATRSFSDELLSPQLAKNISVRIEVKDLKDAGGYCDPGDDNYPFPPREFTIELAKAKKRIHMFLALAHEMVHLKQFAKGEMKDKFYKRKYVKVWQGQYYEENISYWDQPWEIEAYGLENSLVAKFLIKENLFKTLNQKPEVWFADKDEEEESSKSVSE
jgi:hypothetical protein